MSDDKFTEEDVENDGRIKREAGKQLNSVLARESGQLYSMFREWCHDSGLDANIVLGDMLLRAIRDENYAQDLSGVVVNIEKLKGDEVKKEDLEMVTGLIEEYSDDASSGQDPIDNLIERRIQAMGSGPLDGLAGDGQGGQDAKDQKIEQLHRQVESLRAELQGEADVQNVETEEVSRDQQTNMNKMDEMFGDEGGDDGVVEVEADIQEPDEEEQAEEEQIEMVNLGDEQENDSQGDNEQEGEEPNEGNPFTTEGVEE